MDFPSLFQQLGLTTQHAHIYEILLQEGKITILAVAKKTGIPRSSCYEYIPDLVNLKLVQELREKKGRYLQASDPEQLVRAVRDRLDSINAHYQTLLNEKAELAALYGKGKDQPHYKLYDNNHEIQDLLHGLLVERGELLLICQGGRVHEVGFHFAFGNAESFLDVLQKQETPTRELLDLKGAGKDYRDNFTSSDQRVLLLPFSQGYVHHTDKIIAEKTLAIIDFDRQLVVSTDDQATVIAERAQFNALWQLASSSNL